MIDSTEYRPDFQRILDDTIDWLSTLGNQHVQTIPVGEPDCYRRVGFEFTIRQTRCQLFLYYTDTTTYLDWSTHLGRQFVHYVKALRWLLIARSAKTLHPWVTEDFEHSRDLWLTGVIPASHLNGGSASDFLHNCAIESLLVSDALAGWFPTLLPGDVILAATRDQLQDPDESSLAQIFTNGDYQSAAESLLENEPIEFADFDPSVGEIVLTLARFRGRWKEVIRWSDRILALTDEESIVESALGNRARAHYQLGHYAHCLRDCERVRLRFQKAEEAIPLSLCTLAGETLLQLGRPKEVFDWLPQDVGWHQIRADFIRSIAFELIGETDKARTLAQSYQSVIGADPLAARFFDLLMKNKGQAK